ncbi:MAG TPA: DUF5666 domain-containing protein [Patescibacteria group bacterium]|nr:DUF5666 domain-containing protein [Patescibacteria group bacterium]
MSEEHFLQSRTFRGILYGAGICALAFLVFEGGMIVGSRRAFFSCKWGENYYRNFAGERGAFREPPPPFGREMMGGNGSFGDVISVSGSGIVVRGGDDVERRITFDGATVIRRGHDAIGPTDLRPGDRITAIGEPADDGSILARFIRVMPEWFVPRQ